MHRTTLTRACVFLALLSCFASACASTASPPTRRDAGDAAAGLDGDASEHSDAFAPDGGSLTDGTIDLADGGKAPF
jgi:hypothetical protein